MNCPECNEDSYVIDSRKCVAKRAGQGHVLRRRECGNGHRFTTYETTLSPDNVRAKLKLIQRILNSSMKIFAAASKEIELVDFGGKSQERDAPKLADLG